MKKSQLKILLSKLDDLADPTPRLEQYGTPPDIAAELLNHAYIAEDLQTVIDLGTGNGILAVGAAVIGADTTGYDVDEDAIAVAERNRELMEEEIGRELSVSFVAKDVRDVEQSVDTVVMNPPFGLQRGTGGLNTLFVESAFNLAPVVYALLHQSGKNRDRTRMFFQDLANANGFDTTILAWFRLPVPRQFRFHEKKVEHVKVDLYRFFKPSA